MRKEGKIMKMKKRWLSLCLAVALLICIFPVGTVHAETVIASGTCGDNLLWRVNDKSQLIISGSGDMYDYADGNDVPWKPYADKYVSIQLPEGLTSIGDNAFRSAKFGAYGRQIPASVTRIGSRAFPAVSGSGYYLTFLSVPPVIAVDAFEGASGVTLKAPGWPEEVRKSYGATRLYWKVAELVLSSSQDLRFDLNEEITADKLQIIARYSDGETTPYVAKEITIGAYDNSTYGQKTVDITVDGHVIPMTYYVTDGQNHFDMIRVSFNRTPEYPVTDALDSGLDLVVTSGNLTLVKGKDYTVSRTNSQVGEESTLTVTGMGNYEGFSRTYSYYTIRNELDNATCTIPDVPFVGMPVDPEPKYKEDGKTLTGGTDYVMAVENDVNPGTGKVRVIGINGYAGSYTKDFNITLPSTQSLSLPGSYYGEAGGESTGDVYYSDNLLTPCKYTFIPDCNSTWVAQSFELYRVYDEENIELIDSYNRTKDMAYYTYDFSSVYEDAKEEGGYVYMLSYAWVYSSGKVYAGVAALLVPAKVAEAETMQVEIFPDDKDFRRDYIDAWSEDGNLGLIEWKVSDSSVAKMDDGEITYLKPGTVTITGSYGKLSASRTVTVEAQSLNNAILLHYDKATGKASIVYDGFLLKEGTDYTLAATEANGVVEVIAVGKGLFEGTILRQFNAQTEETIGHTHVLSATCDPSCESCDFVRETAHTLAQGWKKDKEGHWHVCLLCKEKMDYAQHTLVDDNNCLICGILKMIGDMNGDYQVTDADAIYLLRYTLFPDSYPIDQDGDFNLDGQVTDADAIYLLRHTLFPENYPLS